jgi:predicted O-linked N-acetylglucosamine transferase (SPINDLY family)
MTDDKKDVLKNHIKYLNNSKNFVSKSIVIDEENKADEFRQLAIKELEFLLSHTNITDYLLLDSNPVFSKEKFLQAYFDLGTLYKTCAEYYLSNIQNNQLTQKQLETIFRKGISSYRTILQVDFENKIATSQIVSIYTQLCMLYNDNSEKCCELLQEALLFSSDNEIIHYNLGFIFQKSNKLEQSLIHYKLSISLSNSILNDKKLANTEKNRLKKLLINNFNGISGIYRSIKGWPEALHYLLKAEQLDSDNPDIQNALGVVYTEMRRTDLAEKAYMKAIKNVDKALISEKNNLLSELYLNFGHMHSYNGDNNKSIDCYNKALQISPNLFLAFQNKIMNLSYVFDELKEKSYITKQHKLINKLLKKESDMFVFDNNFYKKSYINIGIISGDFTDHPVSYFISTFLSQYDSSRFNVTCYSECIIDTSLFHKDLKFKFIKNMSSLDAANLIYNDNIHILFDLAGHTAHNRLDIFALKPSPIQISYIGYPFTTGLNEMDYRITDMICDNPNVSQEYYTEKLLYMNNCFLCYNPIVTKRSNNGQITPSSLSNITDKQPYIENGYITIGCFNRLNKITDSVIKIFNKILLKNDSFRFVFKTKALLNKNIKNTFLNKFDKSVRNRINIIDCTILHEDHLLEYNNIDIAIDTFPYSGTTTSCEALYMGVPVFTIYDRTYYFHPQNVTASILKNSHSDLSFYVVESEDELYTKLEIINNKPIDFWKNMKKIVRTQFLTGDVCNQKKYIDNLSTLLVSLYKNKISNN